MNSWSLIVVVGLVLVGMLVFVIRWRNPDLSPHRITPPARRILFPFIGDSISRPTLDAALPIVLLLGMLATGRASAQLAALVGLAHLFVTLARKRLQKN